MANRFSAMDDDDMNIGVNNAATIATTMKNFTGMMGRHGLTKEDNSEVYTNLHEIMLSLGKVEKAEGYDPIIHEITQLQAGETDSIEDLTLLNMLDYVNAQKNTLIADTQVKAEFNNTRDALLKLKEKGKWTSNEIEKIYDSIEDVVLSARPNATAGHLQNLLIQQDDVSNLESLTRDIKNYDSDPSTMEIDPFKKGAAGYEDFYGMDPYLDQAFKDLLAHKIDDGRVRLTQFEMQKDKAKIDHNAALEINIAKQEALELEKNYRLQGIFHALLQFDESRGGRPETYIDENGQYINVNDWRNAGLNSNQHLMGLPFPGQSVDMQNENLNEALRYIKIGDADKAQDALDKGVKGEMGRQSDVVNQAYESKLDNINAYMYTALKNSGTKALLLPGLQALKADGKTLYGLENLYDEKKKLTHNINYMIKAIDWDEQIHTKNGVTTTLLTDKAIKIHNDPYELVATALQTKTGKPIDQLTTNQIFEFLREQDFKPLTSQMARDRTGQFPDHLARLLTSLIKADGFLHGAALHTQLFDYGQDPGDPFFFYDNPNIIDFSK